MNMTDFIYNLNDRDLGILFGYFNVDGTPSLFRSIYKSRMSVNDLEQIINDSSRDFNSLSGRISKLERLIREDDSRSYREKQRSYTKLGDSFRQSWKALIKARDLIQNDENLSIEKNNTYDKIVSMINELDSLISSCYNY